MTRVAEDGDVGNAAAQLDGDVPQGDVTVEALVVGREAAVDDADALDTGAVDAFKSAHPQVEVRIHGVLYQHRHINTVERVGKFLHGEGICHGARTHPKDVHAHF